MRKETIFLILMFCIGGVLAFGTLEQGSLNLNQDNWNNDSNGWVNWINLATEFNETKLNLFGNAIWCELGGCTMAGDVDMGGYDISNAGQVTGGNTRINGFGVDFMMGAGDKMSINNYNVDKGFNFTYNDGALQQLILDLNPLTMTADFQDFIIKTSSNSSADWFEGQFNWTTTSLNDWISQSFDGTTLTTEFNESKLETEFFNVTSLDPVRGTASGTLSDINQYNGDSYNVTEEAGEIGIDLRLNYTGISDFNEVIFRYKTDSGESHISYLQIYDYDDNDWEDYGSLGAVPEFTIFDFPVYDSESHIKDGIVEVRVYSPENGNINHKHYFDWATIARGLGTPPGQEADTLDTVTNRGNVTDNNIGVANITVEAICLNDACDSYLTNNGTHSIWK